MGFYLLPGGNTWGGGGKHLEQYQHFETVSWLFFSFFFPLLAAEIGLLKILKKKKKKGFP